MYDKSEISANIQHPASVLYCFQKMNLERRLLGMLRLGNYPKRYLKISFFWELLFSFLSKIHFHFISETICCGCTQCLRFCT